MSTQKILERIEQRLAALEQRLCERDDEVLDVTGAMALTGLSKSGIYHKTCSHDGEPPELAHFKQGKRLYFRRSELVRWLTQHRVRNRAELEAATEMYWRKASHEKCAANKCDEGNTDQQVHERRNRSPQQARTKR